MSYNNLEYSKFELLGIFQDIVQQLGIFQDVVQRLGIFEDYL